MFKKIFIDLCNKKSESPSSVCRKVGITPATFSGWTETTIPRQATLQRISDYFGVTPEYLLGETEEKGSPSGEIPEGPDEICAKIITLYSNLEENQKSEALSYLEFLVQKKQQDN
jgi:transcriptional regulator with XRE-family HTH domain